MKILRILARYSPGVVIIISALSVIDGASNAALLGVVSGKLSAPPRGGGSSDAWIFFGLVGLVLTTGYAARVATLYLATRSTYNLRLRLCRQILELPLRDFERMGPSRALSVLTQDVATLNRALLKVPELIVSAVIVCGCLTYLAFLAPLILVALALLIALLFVTYKLPMTRADHMLAASREHSDRLMHHFNALAHGFKELQLNAPRRRSFLGVELEHAARQVREAAFAGLHAHNLAKSWGKILFLVFVGFILYGVGAIFEASVHVLVAYVVTLLYMRDSVTKILDVIPDVAQANVAMRTIQNCGLSVDRLGSNDQEMVGAGWAVTPPAPRFEYLTMRGVTHRYFHEDQGRDFTLGPIDLVLRAGEIIYVVGGNGSGKTTLAKVLTGLYPPEAGELSLNGNPVSESTVEAYRQLFTATFADFHLFDRLIGLEGEGVEERSLAYLSRLQIDHKVSIRKGTFSTTDLSSGQRKRLVLLIACLEDRPVYVFDEWAADQDPVFKAVFYRELLPDLKRRGKAVVVISHDDRYYHLGDRLLKLEDGRLVSNALTVSDERRVSMGVWG